MPPRPEALVTNGSRPRPSRVRARPSLGALRRLAVGAAVIAIVAAAPPSQAQSSAGYRLAGGGFTSSGGTAASRTLRVIGEAGSGLAAERSSTDDYDAIGGLIGSWFSSRARMGFKTGKSVFASIAFPLQPRQTRVTSVLDELGKPNIERWRLGHWSPGDSTYEEAARDDSMEIETGLGYFLITADSTTVFEDGLTPALEETEIDLEDGPGGRPAYNQLGNPFPFPIAVADLSVSDDNDDFPLLGAENLLTERAVKVYNPANGSYITNPAVIEARTAFWVKKLARGSVSIVVPYQVGVAVREESRPAKPAGAAWALAVTAREGSRASEPLVVGAAPVADDGWNPLCVSRAPDPPGGAVGLSIREDRWDRMSDEYVRVFRSPARTMTWDFTARAAQSPGEFALEFETFDLPADARIALTDRRAGWTREISNGETVTLAASQERSLRLTVSSDGVATTTGFEDGLRYVLPNPFRGRAGMVFTLRNGGALEARIYDVGGRFVRALSAVPGSGSGERVLLWDGRDDAGRKTPAGVYLARFRAGLAQGVTRLVKIE